MLFILYLSASSIDALRLNKTSASSNTVLQQDNRYCSYKPSQNSLQQGINCCFVQLKAWARSGYLKCESLLPSRTTLATGLVATSLIAHYLATFDSHEQQQENFDNLAMIPLIATTNSIIKFTSLALLFNLHKTYACVLNPIPPQYAHHGQNFNFAIDLSKTFKTPPDSIDVRLKGPAPLP